MMAWRTLVGDVERFTAPGQVTIDCRAGDDWRIGPATADRPADGGISVSVTTGAGQPVSTSPMTHTETVTVGSTSYTAAVTFECPTDGPTVVAITAAEGSTFAVFPSFRRTAIGLLPALPVGLAGLALVTAGVVLIVTRPKRRTG